MFQLKKKKKSQNAFYWNLAPASGTEEGGAFKGHAAINKFLLLVSVLSYMVGLILKYHQLIFILLILWLSEVSAGSLQPCSEPQYQLLLIVHLLCAGYRARYFPPAVIPCQPNNPARPAPDFYEEGAMIRDAEWAAHGLAVGKSRSQDSPPDHLAFKLFLCVGSSSLHRGVFHFLCDVITG